MKKEYDFTGGVRGKYYHAYQEGTNLVLLDPDLAAQFPDSASVNRALRLFQELASMAATPKRSRTPPTGRKATSFTRRKAR